MSSNKKCQAIEHENLLTGSWGCCSCQTLNSFVYDDCRYCGHSRCYYPQIVIESTMGEDVELPAVVIDTAANPIDPKLLN